MGRPGRLTRSIAASWCMMRVKQNMRTDRPHADKQSKLGKKRSNQELDGQSDQVWLTRLYRLVLDKEESPPNEPTRPNIDRTYTKGYCVIELLVSARCFNSQLCLTMIEQAFHQTSLPFHICIRYYKLHVQPQAKAIHHHHRLPPAWSAMQ